MARRSDPSVRKVRFTLKRNKGVWGLAFPDEWRVELDPEMAEPLLLEIAIHECAHVVTPDLSEEAVDRLGKHAADLLWRLGFRLKHEDD